MTTEAHQQGYVLMYDRTSDSWLACRFDYQVTDDPRWEFLNPEFKIHEEQGTRFDDWIITMTSPDRVTGTTLRFVDPQGKRHELFARHPGEGKTVCVQTLGGPQEALAMLLEEQ